MNCHQIYQTAIHLTIYDVRGAMMQAFHKYFTNLIKS